MADFNIGKISGIEGCECPICGNSEISWERTTVRVDPLSDDRRSWWPPDSSGWKAIGDSVLECATCGLQFGAELLERIPGEWEPV